MADLTRITGRPQQREQASIDPSVSARQGNYLAALPAPNGEMDGLVRALGVLHGPLADMQRRADAATERLTGDSGEADAQRVESPRDIVTGAPVEVPSSVPPAFGETYRRRYYAVASQRAALQNREDATSAYMQQRDLPDFNLDTFLAKTRQDQLAGVQDPHMVAVLGQGLTQLEGELRGEHLQVQLAKHEENRNTAVFKLAEQGFRPDMTPAQMADFYFSTFVPQVGELQVDKKQAAAVMLGRIKSASEAAGGVPELFDVFNTKDAEGFSILSRNPQLQASILEGRHQAQIRRDQAIHQATEPNRARLFMSLDDAVRQNPGSITQDGLVSLVSRDGLTDSQAAEYWSKAQKAVQDAASNAALVAAYHNGTLGRYDPKTQNAVIEQVLGTTIDGLWAAASAGDQRAVQQFSVTLMTGQSKAQSTVPVAALERLLETTVTALPGADGPSAKFKAAAELYKAFSADPQYRDRYFKDDTAAVLGAYTREVAGGVDPKTAYTTAYRAIDPAVKEEARKRASSPDFQAKIAKVAAKYVEGSSFVPSWLGGNGRPENTQALGFWAANEARSIMQRNPDLSDAQVQEHIEKESAKQWVLDETTGLAVKVPPYLGDALTQQAITSYSRELMGRLKDQNRLPEDAVLRYVPTGTEGQLELQVWAGTSRRALGVVSVTQLIDRERMKKVLTPEEGTQLGSLRAALQAGGPLPVLPYELMGKARAAGFFKGTEQAQLESRNRAQFLERLKQVPAMSFGAPTNNEAIPDRGPVKIDNQLTARMALEFAAQGTPEFGMSRGPTDAGHLGLASSLITAREGVVLQAYDDPAKGAGKNIGMGYNLKANADTVDSDLKRAGVPEDMAGRVKEGTAALTPDQAKRLLQVSLERYEKQVRATAESVAPGLWGQMPPARKAVMIDIAWQAGDPSRFKKAWAALAANDAATFAAETKVFYTNKAGDRVEDIRASDLRASLLSGIAHWNARVSVAGKRPSTALQSSLLGAK